MSGFRCESGNGQEKEAIKMSGSEKIESEKIGALWKQKSRAGTDYLAGIVNNERVVVFQAKKKSANGPDYQVFKSSPRATNANRANADPTTTNTDSNTNKKEVPF
jgi:uncharacterized protein (DUF736 family)